MLNLIHNLRFDRNDKDSDHSFKKNLNNFSTSELSQDYPRNTLSNKFVASDWLSIYRGQ
ncbi:MAG: hypothetical protein ACJ0G4_02905 [Alphaproteobacteria bacterium]